MTSCVNETPVSELGDFIVMPVTLFGVELDHACAQKLTRRRKVSGGNSSKLVRDIIEKTPDETTVRLPEILDALPYPPCDVPGLRFHAVTEEWETAWTASSGPKNSDYTIFLAVMLGETPDSFSLSEASEVAKALTETVLKEFLSCFDLDMDAVESGPAFFTRVLS